MEWCKLYANLVDNPRVQAAEDDGQAGWLLIQSFCYVTHAESLLAGEGFIPDTQVRRFGCTPEQVAALRRETLWIRDDLRKGYVLDPEIWNEDRNLSDSAEKKRKADRDRMREKRAAAKSAQDGEVSRDSSATGRATVSRDSRALDKKRQEKNLPPTPRQRQLWPAAEPDAKPGEGEEPQNDDQARDVAVLVAEVRAIRNDWPTESIVRELNDPSNLERPWPLVRAAALIMARDPSSKLFGRLKHDGPWWQEARAQLARQAAPPPSVKTHPYEPDASGTCRCGLPKGNQHHENARAS